MRYIRNKRYFLSLLLSITNFFTVEQDNRESEIKAKSKL